MSRRLLIVFVLLAAAASVFAVAEAAPGGERLPASGPGTLVAVVDTGVDPAIVAGTVPGIDLVDGDDDAADPNGHGTAVAAAVTERCANCTILPVRVLSPRGGAPWSRVAAGIVWAVDHGARVVNVSLSGPDGSRELRAAVAYAAARDVLVVAAAGNAGEIEPAFPAAYPGVVSVGATDAAGVLHDWSSRGGWLDVAAPGCAQLPVNGATSWACGTSFAAPTVSATAALARAASPEASAPEIASELAGLLDTRQASPVVSVVGTPRAGSVVTARTGELGRGAALRWFRCGASACTAVGRGAAYRVRVSDTGTTLVARVVTKAFGGLSLAASAPLEVR